MSKTKDDVEAKQVLNLYIEERERLARLDELRRCFGQPRWQWEDSPKRMSITRGEIYDRIKELEG